MLPTLTAAAKAALATWLEETSQTRTRPLTVELEAAVCRSLWPVRVRAELERFTYAVRGVLSRCRTAEDYYQTDTDAYALALLA